MMTYLQYNGLSKPANFYSNVNTNAHFCQANFRLFCPIYLKFFRFSLTLPLSRMESHI